LAAEISRFELPNDSLGTVSEIIDALKEGFRDILEPLEEIRDIISHFHYRYSFYKKTLKILWMILL